MGALLCRSFALASTTHQTFSDKYHSRVSIQKGSSIEEIKVRKSKRRSSFTAHQVSLVGISTFQFDSQTSEVGKIFTADVFIKSLTYDTDPYPPRA
ncbi:MAG: hypothetical protein JWQ35_2669 [Bacteriovoracaceae bacterium]|nr:hypothetical protein [Bacteriovoracaceae bacterium]